MQELFNLSIIETRVQSAVCLILTLISIRTNNSLTCA